MDKPLDADRFQQFLKFIEDDMIDQTVEEAVKEFMVACDQRMITINQPPDHTLLGFRAALVEEEYQEINDALHKISFAYNYENQCELLDGLVDLVYVAVGFAVALGLPFDDAFREVHRANMAKVDPDTGKVTKDADGKVLKPANWTPPDYAGLMLEAADKLLD